MKKFLFLFLITGCLLPFCVKAQPTRTWWSDLIGTESEKCLDCSSVCRCKGETAYGKFVYDFYNKQDTVVRGCNNGGQNIMHVDLANGVCELESKCGSDPDAVCNIVTIQEDTVDYCCCKKASSGTLTTNYNCKKVGYTYRRFSDDQVGNTDYACSESVFNGGFGEPGQSDPGFQFFLLDDAGSCAKWEQASTTATGVNKTNVTDNLRSEAAGTLNPMGFKAGKTGINTFIGKIINAITGIMGSILLLFYIYAGILWMSSAGNSERVNKAKQIFVWSTLGIVVVLASYLIVSTVFKTFS